ncbi:MAG TPA: hypothetical protein PLS67_13495, partial [Accumulibacter sp.]|nr:hypothetical protein [Accumulibacter sp.]
MAQALSFPVSFFALNEVRLGFGSSSYFYRKKITTASERNKISGIVNLIRIHLSMMLKPFRVLFFQPLDARARISTAFARATASLAAFALASASIFESRSVSR